MTAITSARMHHVLCLLVSSESSGRCVQEVMIYDLDVKLARKFGVTRHVTAAELYHEKVDAYQ